MADDHLAPTTRSVDINQMRAFALPLTSSAVSSNLRDLPAVHCCFYTAEEFHNKTTLGAFFCIRHCLTSVTSEPSVCYAKEATTTIICLCVLKASHSSACLSKGSDSSTITFVFFWTCREVMFHDIINLVKNDGRYLQR